MKAMRLLSLWIGLLFSSVAPAAPPGFVKSTIPLGASPVALAFDSDGVLYALESTFENNQVTLRTIFPDGTFGASFVIIGQDPYNFYVGGMVYDPWEDRLLVTDSAGSAGVGRLYAIDKTGIEELEVLASDIGNIAGVAVRSTGEIFVSTAVSGGGAVLQIDRLTHAKTLVLDGLELGAGLGFDLAGGLIVQDAHLTPTSELRGRLQRLPITDSPSGLQFDEEPVPLIENMNSSYSLIVDSEGDIFTTGSGGLYMAGSSLVETPFDNNGSSFQFAAAIAFDPGSLPFEGYAGMNAGRLAYTADFADTFVTLLTPAQPGDYNTDGRVDEADYATWRGAFGSMTDLAADGNRDSLVDAADYVLWRKSFQPLTENSSTMPPLSVPESTTMIPVIVALASIGLRRRRQLRVC